MKRLVGLGALLLALPAQGQVREGIFYSALGAADLMSTRYAEQRGAHEANPLMRGSVTRYALKVAQAGALTWLDKKAGQRSKKLQWGVRIGVLALNGYVVAHNIRVGNRAGSR